MGALTSKIYAFEARPWELKKEKGIDPYEGKEVLFELRGLEILRALPREGWISDKIRIILDSFDLNRLLLPKKWVFQKGGLSERSMNQLGKTLSLLFFKREKKKRKKSLFFFPIFFEVVEKDQFSFERERKRWSYIIY